MDPAVQAQAISTIIGYPVFGSLCIVLLVAYYKKDQELQRQSKDNLELVVALQEKIITAVSKMSDLMEFIEKRERERELQRAREEGQRERRVPR